MGDLFPTRSHARDLWVFFTVLCLWVANFLRGARREIYGYFNVQIWVTRCTRIETYRPNARHTRVSTDAHNVPYPIERTRSVLCRHAIGFQIGPRQSAVESTW
jgi:hypothetical protein